MRTRQPTQAEQRSIAMGISNDGFMKQKLIKIIAMWIAAGTLHELGLGVVAILCGVVAALATVCHVRQLMYGYKVSREVVREMVADGQFAMPDSH